MSVCIRSTGGWVGKVFGWTQTRPVVWGFGAKFPASPFGNHAKMPFYIGSREANSQKRKGRVSICCLLAVICVLQIPGSVATEIQLQCAKIGNPLIVLHTFNFPHALPHSQLFNHIGGFPFIVFVLHWLVLDVYELSQVGSAGENDRWKAPSLV